MAAPAKRMQVNLASHIDGEAYTGCRFSSPRLSHEGNFILWGVGELRTGRFTVNRGLSLSDESPSIHLKKRAASLARALP